MIGDEAEARAYVRKEFGAEMEAGLEVYAEALRKENAEQNLVAPASLDAIWQRHFVDSLQLLRFVPRETRSLLDLGSGAGFPGIVLAMARPATSINLVESRKRRIEWLSMLVQLLGLTNCTIHGSRLQVVSPFEAGAITARAFASLRDILTLSAPFSTSDTRWVLPKGRSAEQELEDLPAAMKAMFHVEQSITAPDAGIIVGHGAIASETRKRSR